MDKDEMINKMLEMLRECYELVKNDISEADLLKSYVEIKARLETTKALKELERGK